MGTKGQLIVSCIMCCERNDPRQRKGDICMKKKIVNSYTQHIGPPFRKLNTASETGEKHGEKHSR